ncbi:L-seryl-tRNA(Sec) selenium transferase [Filobacillus milosensis]|uniref:L-seryl-tRNA(Sec) selenium transferase n=1 Tax=Filobacillus milosensis TaxID=94137 RepID=A0A4Y8INR0_9BACI|nr:L-seryl-tRNA(Sec) selenium transferase [Filobacillus milosensis]TFB23107.1 L-seryl-tRNA(Sec) selenium transferase [Filobacillus milosensis]
MTHSLRVIPPIHELLQQDKLLEIKDDYHLSDASLKRGVQKVTESLRTLILKEEIQLNSREEAIQHIIEQTIVWIHEYYSFKLKPVINATGTVLHTNLGRARIAESALMHMVEVGRHYSTLEFDETKGERGSRHSIVEEYLKELTGAEAAMVVNNNAASVYMILSAFAKGKEAIVSRGELVEIGGSFRVSSIMEESGTILKEVGTTNKTHLNDYKQVINDNTNMIMKVHTSNFHMIGFTESVEREELSHLAKQHNLICYEDLGSGMVYDLTQHGIGQEPLVKQVIESGVDLVSFSGDKLLGGPQVGVIAGKKQYINQLKKHQLARVLRVDKLSYAALEETLRLLLRAEYKSLEIPTVRDVTISKEELKDRVLNFLKRTNEIFNNVKFAGVDLESKVGGGTLPEVVLPSYGLVLKVEKVTINHLMYKLRGMEMPVIARVENNQIIFDFRTISHEEEDILIKQLVVLDDSL